MSIKTVYNIDGHEIEIGYDIFRGKDRQRLRVDCFSHSMDGVNLTLRHDDGGKEYQEIMKHDDGTFFTRDLSKRIMDAAPHDAFGSVVANIGTALNWLEAVKFGKAVDIVEVESLRKMLVVTLEDARKVRAHLIKGGE